MLMEVGLLGHSFIPNLKLGHSLFLLFYIYTFEHLFGLLQEGNLESTVTLSSSVVLCLHPFEVWFGLLLKDFGVRESVKKMFFFRNISLTGGLPVGTFRNKNVNFGQI